MVRMGELQGNRVSRSLDLSVEREFEKTRRSVQRTHTFSGNHQWRRNERQAYKSRPSDETTASKGSSVRTYKLQQPLGEEYSQMSGVDSNDSVPQQISIARSIFEDASAIVQQGGVIYVLDDGIVFNLETRGISPKQFRKYEAMAELVYTQLKSNLVYVSEDKGRPFSMRLGHNEDSLSPSALRNLLYGGYRDAPDRSSHQMEHTATRST